MKKDDLIKRLFKTYKFDKPLPDDVRKHVIRAKKETLIEILKQKKKYTLFLLFVITLFFWVKRFGIALSVAKSAFVVSTAIVVIIGAVMGGTAYSIKHFLIDKPDKVREQNKDKGKIEKIKPVEHKKVVQIDYKLSIVPFEYEKDINEIGNTVNIAIRNELVRIKGRGAANFIWKIPKEKRPKRMLTGSVIKLGDIYRISAKIIDMTNSRVILYVSENAESADDIKRTCKVLSKKIAEKI